MTPMHSWEWLWSGVTRDTRVLRYPLIYRHVGDIYRHADVKELQVSAFVESTGRISVRATAITDEGARTATGYLSSWHTIIRRLVPNRDVAKAVLSALPATTVFEDLWERIEANYPRPDLFDFNPATFRITINHFAAAEYLASRHFMAVVSDSGRIDAVLRWNPKTGIWRRDGAAYIAGALARAIPDEELHKLITANTVRNVMLALASVSSITTEEFARTFNDYTRYMPVANGILDMDRRKLLPFSPDFRFTFKLAVRYDPRAKARRIRRFIHEIAGSREDEENILRMIGYILVPKQPLQSFFILYGSGANGKSTLVKVLRSWLGDELVATRTLADLLHNRFAFAELDGKLLNAATETPRGGHREVDRLKAVTGGDSVTVERKFQSAYFRELDAKLVFAANDLPDLPLDDVALFRRVVLIQFPHRFPKNPAFEQSLLVPEELSGLLNLALKYRRIVMREGFLTGAAEEVRMEYIRRAKPLLAFAQEAIEPHIGSEVRPLSLYLAFLRWCEKHGVESTYYISRAEWTRMKEEGRIHVQVASFVRSLEKEWRALHDEGFESDRTKYGSVIRDIRLVPEIAALIGEDDSSESAPQSDVIDIAEDTRPAAYIQKVIMAAKNLAYQWDSFTLDQLVEEAKIYGVGEDQVEDAVSRMLKDGVLEEVRPGTFKLIGG